MDEVDSLADALRAAARGAEPELTRALVGAARAEGAHGGLEKVAKAALAAGVGRGDIIRACDAARLEIRTAAGVERDFEDIAEDHVLDLMDRLVGWCQPGARL
ncbi:hypothetical protein JOD54_005276 [Actinokineospora baliensis]|uniref:hypothetical protein n=1 Tax=Actinokineospora baliensis TaxID=547056 RepID=UPI0027DC1193|nr:hypothetical protein [Actinokineospora baliensis]MBM7775072.1 hypothetical protein [Actinokineospora baliensis]